MIYVAGLAFILFYIWIYYRVGVYATPLGGAFLLGWAALSVGLTEFYPSIEPEIDVSLDPAVASPSEFEMHEVMHYFAGITDPGVRESILASIKLVSSFEA